MFHQHFLHLGSSRSGSSSSRVQGPSGGLGGPGRQGGPGSQTDGGPGQRAQLQQQAQTSAARPGQPGATPATGPQQQTPTQSQGMGIGQGQTKPGQMGPAGGPMGQTRQTSLAGTTPVTMVRTKQKYKKKEAEWRTLSNVFFFYNKEMIQHFFLQF